MKTILSIGIMAALAIAPAGCASETTKTEKNTTSTVISQEPVVAPDTVTVAQEQQPSDPYLALAQELAASVEKGTVDVSVVNFVYEDTNLMSPFSSLLRDELERVLPLTGKFEVITRSRLADLQYEDKFQAQQASDPDAGTKGLKIKGVKALVRGRFYYKYPDVTVCAELAWMEGGQVQKAKVVVPAGNISARIWPDAPQLKEEAALNGVINPQELVASRVNVQDVASRLAKVPHDFPVQLVVNQGKRDFAQGETISYHVQTGTGCHLAIFCHQVDGSTVVLFPNEFQRNTWVAAGTGVDIPNVGKDTFQFKIQRPFGADVVQVIACTKASALHQMISQYTANIDKGMGVRGIDRGIVVEGLNSALSPSEGSQNESGGLPRWSEEHVVVCTYPKFDSVGSQ